MALGACNVCYEELYGEEEVHEVVLEVVWVVAAQDSLT